MFGLQKVGKSYRALTIGGITLLIGTMVLADVMHSLNGIISYVLYFLSIGAIICGILIPYQVHNELEKRVNKLEEFFGIKSDKAEIEIKSHQSDSSNSQTKLQSTIMVVATGVIAFFTVVLVIITIYQYNIENFEPIVDMNDGMITVIPGFYSFYNSTYGISISATTNHNLRFTVINASIDNINYPYAKCFFSTLPTIRSFDQTSIIFGKNADVKILTPEVSLDYTVNPSFLFVPNVPSTFGAYQLAMLKFDILMEDLQDKNKKEMKEGYSNIIVKLPYERYHDLITNCTSVQKHLE